MPFVPKENDFSIRVYVIHDKKMYLKMPVRIVKRLLYSRIKFISGDVVSGVYFISMLLGSKIVKISTLLPVGTSVPTKVLTKTKSKSGFAMHHG